MAIPKPLLGLLIVSGAIATCAAQDRLNVLFVAVDDLRAELGCYGVADARTPNLDRLAREGVLFRNHYVQVPTCGASRYALLTGRSPARSRAMGNNALYNGPSRLSQDQLPGAQTFVGLFRRSGYHTVGIGKISHTADGLVYAYDGSGDGRRELPHAWDELATPYGSWRRGWGAFFAYAGGRHREDGNGHRDLLQFVAEDDEDLPDGMMARTAVAKLRELKERDQPFFLGLGFFKPHLPFVATRADWQAMADVEITAPPHPERTDSRHWHPSNEFYGYDLPFAETRPLAPGDRVAARRAYLACVRYVDRQVGVVLAALDDLQLSQSTIVVVWGDHGWHLGDSAIWGKHSPFERALRSTLIVRAPGVSVPGTVSDALVETLDLYPTLVELCQPSFERTSHPLDGRSLVPLLTGEEASIREAAISYWGAAVSVRTRDYRLIASGSGETRTVELYEMGDGPDPVDDVAAERPGVVARLLELVPSGR